MKVYLLVMLVLLTAFAIGSSLEAINPHREKGGPITSWFAAIIWAAAMGFAVFVFSTK